MTIHDTDPFATPEGDRSALRRLRGHLPLPVTLWTCPGPAGLTVSSVLVADGDPGRLVGLVDEESDFWTAVQAAGRFAVAPLLPEHGQLADRFAGLLPAPGGVFAGLAVRETGYGPVPVELTTWAGLRLDGSEPLGWSLLVRATVATVRIGTEPGALLHYRGRYRPA